MKTIFRLLGITVIASAVVFAALACKGPMGPQGPKGDPGADGVSIVWMGELSSPPSGAQENWAYYNTAAGSAYIYDGRSWRLLAQDGVSGVSGVSMAWQGERTSHPANPQLNWAYYNSADNKSYIWDGSAWQVLAKDGEVGPQGPKGDKGDTGADGVSVSWRGELASAPLSPQLNWAYYNTAEKKSYIYDGAGWKILAQDGSDGSNGISISWQGEFAFAPASPQLNWAYYNSTEKKSYIWDGAAWKVLAKDGADGVTITWKGESAAAPGGAQLNWAYFNTTVGNAYIYDGASWQLLAQRGATGADGVSITWKGEFAAAPASPQLNWAYYNSADRISYIWNGAAWQVLAKDGEVGPQGPKGDPGEPWDPGVNTYLFIFNANGGTPTPATQTIIYGNLAAQPITVSKTGYAFGGWYKEPTHNNLWNFASDIVTANTTLYAKWNAVNYTVTYNANGGSGTMADSAFTYDAPQELRVNAFAWPGRLFTGWSASATGPLEYADRETVINLGSTEGEIVTLYAVWDGPVITVSGVTLASKLSWIQDNAESDITYNIEVNSAEGIGPTSLSYSGKSNITINLKGIGSMRIISLTSSGSMFTIGTGVTLVLEENITLQGRSSNNASLVNVSSGGNLTMNTGSKITGNTSVYSSGVTTSGRGGGVYVAGIFVMDGGEISGNTSSSSTYSYDSCGGGVYVTGGSFAMSGGEISGNTSYSSYSSYSYGGGVYITGGSFAMSGGEISGNTSSASGSCSYGGGVYVTGGSFTISGGEISGNTSYFSSSSSSPYGGGGVYADTAYFSKTGGIIYGYDSAESKSNIVKSGSGAGVILTNRGSAIYATSPDEVKRMEDNAEPGAFLLFDGSVNPPVWSGDWDY